MRVIGQFISLFVFLSGERRNLMNFGWLNYTMGFYIVATFAR
jgi:hypothetical protein